MQIFSELIYKMRSCLYLAVTLISFTLPFKSLAARTSRDEGTQVPIIWFIGCFNYTFQMRAVILENLGSWISVSLVTEWIVIGDRRIWSHTLLL